MKRDDGLIRQIEWNRGFWMAMSDMAATGGAIKYKAPNKHFVLGYRFAFVFQSDNCHRDLQTSRPDWEYVIDEWYQK